MGDSPLRHECCYTWTTCDRCHRKSETRKIRGSDYCRGCYPIILGLPHPVIDDSWLPLEPFEHLIAAARFIAATERYGPGFWANYSIGFLLQLPISLAYNTDIIVQILPYLNSLSELPAPLQAKLLRVIEERVVHRLGSRKDIPIDVRILAATNKDPQEAVRDGTLREDLLYRLNVFKLWHQKHVAERNARDQYLAAAGFTPKNYRTTDPLLSQLSARERRRRRVAKAPAPVSPET